MPKNYNLVILKGLFFIFTLALKAKDILRFIQIVTLEQLRNVE